MHLKLKRAALVVAVLLLAAGVYFITRTEKQPPQEELLDIWQGVVNASSCRFELTAQVETAGGVRDYFSLHGCTEGTAAALEGQVLGTDTALVFCDGMLYQRIDGKWHAHRMGEIAAAAELFAELLPLNIFAAQVSGCSEPIRTEDGRWQVEVTAEAQGWVGQYFNGARYVMLCDPAGGRPTELTLEADSRSSSGSRLLVRAVIDGIGETQGITSPC